MAIRFGQDIGVMILSYRSLALWVLGYPEAALADTERALMDAREISHAGTLMYALFHVSLPHIWCGNYATANAIVDELVALADEKGSPFWKAIGMVPQGCLLALAGKALDAVRVSRMLPRCRRGGYTPEPSRRAVFGCR